MIEVRMTETFRQWAHDLRDDRANARVHNRLDRLATGNFGDVRSVGGGVSELRIDYGPGYRLYFTLRGNKLVILLCGCDKRTQARDIKLAQKMAKDLE